MCRGPVVVEPEREVFLQLLLHKNAFQDHIPDNYVQVLEKLAEMFKQPATTG